MYHIAEALARWLAPITSFTADEIWRFLPGERAESVFLSTWYEGLFPLQQDAAMNREFWDYVLSVRDAVSKELEVLRVREEIGSSLAAEVEIYCEPEPYARLSLLEDELRFVLITSYAQVLPASPQHSDKMPTALPGVELKVRATDKPKCVRCWHYRHDVGVHAEHPELCGRCVENVEGAGESRRYA
jgi:isoleucyl-tRNA synthetase